MILKINTENLELLEIYENCHCAADDLEYSYEEIFASVNEQKKLGNVQFFMFQYVNPDELLRNINPVIKFYNSCPRCVYCNISLGYNNNGEYKVKRIDGDMWFTDNFGWAEIKLNDEQKRKIRRIMKCDSKYKAGHHIRPSIIALVDINKHEIIAKYTSVLAAKYEDMLFSADEIDNSLKNNVSYNGLQFFNVECNGKTSDVRIKSNSYPVLEYKNGKYVALYKSANAAYDATKQCVAKYLASKIRHVKDYYSEWFKINKCCD